MTSGKIDIVAPKDMAHHWRRCLFLFEKGNSEAIDFFFEKQFLKGESVRNPPQNSFLA
jgi:hypothetical protein